MRGTFGRHGTCILIAWRCSVHAVFFRSLLLRCVHVAIYAAQFVYHAYNAAACCFLAIGIAHGDAASVAGTGIILHHGEWSRAAHHVPIELAIFSHHALEQRIVTNVAIRAYTGEIHDHLVRGPHYHEHFSRFGGCCSDGHHHQRNEQCAHGF